MPLYVVATPIGNLEDISQRGLETLRTVDAIVAEDTRHTRGLLTHFDIHKPLLSLPAFDERARVEPLVARLVAGESLALVTDAGTPAISDPGEAFVDAAWAAGVTVTPIPGPSAALAALSASGLPSSRFVFVGFLPRQGESRRSTLDWLLKTGETAVIFEAGNRLSGTLQELLEILGDRRAVVARELTKLHEELARGALSTLTARFSEGARGEVVIVVEGGTPPVKTEPPPLDEEIQRRLKAGESVRDIAAALATVYQLPKQQIYARTLQLRDGTP